jgi:toxin ParE1/3/4
MTYGFHPEARLEYLEAIDFYESRRTGLGAAFTREVEATIQRILEEPTRWRIIEQDVHRCLTHTFPFGILYTIEGDFVRSPPLRMAAASQDTGVTEFQKKSDSCNGFGSPMRSAKLRQRRFNSKREILNRSFTKDSSAVNRTISIKVGWRLTQTPYSIELLRRFFGLVRFHRHLFLRCDFVFRLRNAH